MNGAASDKSEEGKHFDLSEQASRRGDEKSTNIARQVECDDSNEETDLGAVNNLADRTAENKVWTSLSEE